MKKIILTINIFIVLIMGGLFTKTVEASSGLPFLVEPILPSNQDKGIENYISITPDSNSIKQELEFLVSNKTDTKQEIKIKLFNAYTSGNGGIQYAEEGTENNIIIDEKYEIQQYLDAPEKVVLNGGENKIVKIGVNISDIKGTILGAIAFEGIGEIQKTEKEGISFEIKNQINTVYGIAINFPTEDKYKIEFGQPYVDPMPSYYAVRLPITFKNPIILKDAAIDYEVEFEGEKLFYSNENIDFAPMTKTNFTIPFEYKEIERNKPYILKGTITYLDKNGAEQTEKFEYEFVYKVDEEKITKQTDKKIIEAPVEIEKNEFPFWILLLIPLIVLVYYYKKKNKEQK